MNQIIVSQLDALGYFMGQTTADESPLEPGVFLLPGGSVDKALPTFEHGKLLRMVGGEWIFENPPPPPEPPSADDALLALREAVLVYMDLTGTVPSEVPTAVDLVAVPPN